jgi:alpha-tubulin suppressor-like RCC1 family protein
MIEENENKLVPTLTLLEGLQQHFSDKGKVLDGVEPCYLSLGVTHSAIITRNGDLYTGGSKLDGQLGVKFNRPLSNTNNCSSMLLNT